MLRSMPRLILASILVGLAGTAVLWIIGAIAPGNGRYIAGTTPPAERVKALFQSAKIAYPPEAVVFAAFKQERLLEVYAETKEGWRLVHRYEIFGASGFPGPKLKEGDHQVPEGVYGIESLHPNSRYHLALRVNYPNDFDREMAAADRRTDLGGDIMIHGGGGSVGCIAMGDANIEELYALAESLPLRAIKLVIAPFDLRTEPRDDLPRSPEWTKTLYQTIAVELARLPVSSSSDRTATRN